MVGRLTYAATARNVTLRRAYTVIR